MSRVLPFLLACLFTTIPASADTRTRLPERMTPIEPVNVQKPMTVVVGTVTVRARGVPVEPPDVTYQFRPEFPFSSGYLAPLGGGRYRLQIPNVPNDVPRTLTIRATHDDTELRDGKIIRRGTPSSGSLRLQIPPGDRYDAGSLLLDLN